MLKYVRNLEKTNFKLEYNADFSQVLRAVRVDGGNGIIRYEDNIFDEYIHFVDVEFLDMFTFPLKYGKKNALRDRNAMIFSEETAIKSLILIHFSLFQS